jgi:hypothetical protein
MAPTAAKTGAKTAPTTPTVKGNMTKVLPLLSLIVIRRTLPSFINCLTLDKSWSPFTLNDSSFF